MLVTESGIVIFCKEKQQENVPSSMHVTESEIVMFCKDLQLQNAEPPMHVTESGMMNSFSFEQKEMRLHLPFVYKTFLSAIK